MHQAYLLLLFLLCSGCGSTVLPLYEEQRSLALADPLPAPANWTPDGRIALSERMLQTILAEAILEAQKGGENRALGGPGFSGTPNIRLQKLSLAEGNCTDCVALTVSFTGDLDWKLLTKRGKSPFSATASLQSEVLIDHDKEGWHTRLVPKDIEDVRLETEAWSGTLNTALSKPLESWLKAQITQTLPEIPLATFQTRSLPVQAARARSLGGALTLEFLSGGTTTSPIPPVKLRKGWSVNLSTATLVSIARAESFRHGPDTHSVVVTPLRFQAKGQGFELDIRIWRLKGAGWWRDYQVTGQIGAKPGAIKLTSQSVVELDQSPGAAFVDPLAALGEALIIKAIEDAITTSLPNTKSVELGKKNIELSVLTIGGGSDFLRVGGVTTIR
jgi:hypothetical protein